MANATGPWAGGDDRTAPPSSGGSCSRARGLVSGFGLRWERGIAQHVPRFLASTLEGEIHTRPIGRSGVSVSAVGLGGYELGPEPGEEPNVDRAERVIRTALEAGVDWLDTSENYLDTRNETLIGEALARIDDDFLIASKAACRGRKL